MVFDIESFYPSITESLFANATQSAKQITEISDFEVALINKKRYCLMKRQHGGFLMGERGAGGVWARGNFYFENIKDFFSKQHIFFK